VRRLVFGTDSCALYDGPPWVDRQEALNRACEAERLGGREWLTTNGGTTQQSVPELTCKSRRCIDSRVLSCACFLLPRFWKLAACEAALPRPADTKGTQGDYVHRAPGSTDKPS
jgi:hypothetical protein